MNKDFFNKFLYFGFKFGKVFASIVLIILCLIMFFSSIYLINVNNTKFEIPQFSVLREQLEKNNTNTDKQQYSNKNINTTKQDVENKYYKKIEKIVFDNNLDQSAYNLILDNLVKYSSKYQTFYIEGLEGFIPESLEYIKSKQNLNNYNISQTILPNIIFEYNNMFDNEIMKIKEQENENFQNKIIAGSILVISILLFVICLFLPLLIKIEENTREFIKIAKKSTNSLHL